MSAATRRSLLGGVAVAPLLTLSFPTPQGADADLLALGRNLDAAWANEMLVGVESRTLPDKEADQIFEAACDRTRIIVDQIEARSATTLDGLIVKARAISWCHSGEAIHDDSLNAKPATDGRLAAGVVRDLLAMGGRA